MQEKLQKIKARCEELLAIAEKRTAGKWDDGNMREWFAVYTEPQDAAFIASCAGPAEAGWRATIATIDRLQLIHGQLDWGNDAAWDALEEIVAAWPDELLK